MLIKQQENDLETIQKKCLRCIFGYKKSYDEFLRKSGMSTLKARREKAVLKFTAKTSRNPTSDRNPPVYLEEFSWTQRLYNSPLFHVRRLLNKTDHDNLPEMNYMDLAYLFDDRRTLRAH